VIVCDRGTMQPVIALSCCFSKYNINEKLGHRLKLSVPVSLFNIGLISFANTTWSHLNSKMSALRTQSKHTLNVDKISTWFYLKNLVRVHLFLHLDSFFCFRQNMWLSIPHFRPDQNNDKKVIYLKKMDSFYNWDL